MSSLGQATAIRRAVTVRVPIETAFRIFTEELGSWWPLRRSAEEDGLADEALMEPHLGGAVYERWADGRLNSGDITVWEPPGRVVFSGRLGGEPEQATEVEVRFIRAGGATRVELEHRGWERLGERAAAGRQGYDAGWESALRRYTKTAERRERS